MYNELIEIYKIHKKEKTMEVNKIPIWLILLRLLCNINNIEVDYKQENNDLSKRISENQSIYLRNLINKLSNSYYNNHNVKFDYKWLNISIKQLNNIYVCSRKSRNLFDYIYSQIKSIPELKEEISKIIENNLIELNKEIIDEQLKDNIDKFYNLLLTDNNKFIQMISNPKEFYINEIKKNYDEIMNQFLNSNEFKELREYYFIESQNSIDNGKDKKPFISFYNSLKKEINNTLEKIDIDYKKSLNEKINNKYDKTISELTTLINGYNNDIKKLEKFYKKDLIKEKSKNLEVKDLSIDQNQNLEKIIDNSQKGDDIILNKINNHDFDNSKITLDEFNNLMIDLNKKYIKNLQDYYEIDKTKSPLFIYMTIDLEFKKKILKQIIKIFRF
jgi:hypothetical protein